MEPVKCIECGRARTDQDRDYEPFSQVVLKTSPMGWYSGDDGEICGECMDALINHANR